MVMKENVPELTGSEFEGFTKEGIVLIDFFAEWCMPCVRMGPVIDELNDEFKGKVKFGKVNIEDNRNLANKFNIMSIPNFVLFKNGKVIEQVVGEREQEELSDIIKKAIKK